MTKASGIFVSSEPKEVPFVWEGETYTFKVVEPTWNQKNTLLSKCMTASSGGKPEINLAKYNEEMLLMVVKDCSGLFELNKLEVKRFSDKFGESIERQIIPNPFSSKGMTEEDEKN